MAECCRRHRRLGALSAKIELLGSVACAYNEAYCSSMMLKIITRQRGNGVISLPLIQSKTKCDSASYRRAVEDAFEIVDKIDEIVWAEFDE